MKFFTNFFRPPFVAPSLPSFFRLARPDLLGIETAGPKGSIDNRRLDSLVCPESGSEIARELARAELFSASQRSMSHLNPVRFLKQISRDLRRGWTGSHAYYKFYPQIAGWRWPFWNEPVRSVSLHITAGKEDWLTAGWTLASFFNATRDAWRVVVHDDGTLPPEAENAYARMFPSIQIIEREESDHELSLALAGFPATLDLRSRSRSALQLIDSAHYAGIGGEQNPYISMEAGWLFFKQPNLLLDWSGALGGTAWVAQSSEKAAISEKEALDELGVALRPGISTTLGLLNSSVIDTVLCERALTQTALSHQPPAKAARTLLSVCCSRLENIRLLPKQYEEPHPGPRSADSVARTYSGIADDAFFSEGLTLLAPILLDEDY